MARSLARRAEPRRHIRFMDFNWLNNYFYLKCFCRIHRSTLFARPKHTATYKPLYPNPTVLGDAASQNAWNFTTWKRRGKGGHDFVPTFKHLPQSLLWVLVLQHNATSATDLTWWIKIRGFSVDFIVLFRVQTDSVTSFVTAYCCCSYKIITVVCACIMHVHTCVCFLLR